MLLLNTCVGDIEASPQPSPWERAYRYSCLLISYKTNLAPSPTERAGGETSKLVSNKQSVINDK